MKKMNGKIAATVCAVVLLTAGSAFAWGGQGGKPMGGQGMMYWQNNQGMYQAAPGVQAPLGNRQMTGRRGNFGGMGPAGSQQMMGRRGNFGNAGRMGMWASVEIPQEIRDKQTEMAKLSIEMRNEMGKKPIDRTKLEELYKKRVELRNELTGWRMKQRLDLIEKLQK